jgi:hypothetical protein
LASRRSMPPLSIGAPPGQESAASRRDRMGRYLAACLTERQELRKIGWPLETAWNEWSIWATLSRGELALKADVTRREWWEPQSRRRTDEWTAQLTQLLVGLHALYRDADPSGRLRVGAWAGPEGRISWEHRTTYEPVWLMLEPGVRIGTENGGSLGSLYRLGEDVGLRTREALRAGWFSVIQ